MENKKIKVLHVIDSMNYGGAETIIMNIFRNIDREKFEFGFLCTNKNTFDYENEILELGGKIHRIDSVSSVGVFENVKQMKNVMKENKYEVVHSHGMLFSGIVCMSAFLAGVKIRISHSHSTKDPRVQTFSRKIYTIICKILIKLFVNRKISCGEMAAKFLYNNTNNVILIYNGIELKKYENVTKKNIDDLRNELGINEDEIVIGTVGRVEAVKNHEYFIDLANNLSKMNSKFKIVIVGSGSLLDNLIQKVNENGLQKHFIFTYSRKDIPELMSMFDAFVLPSFYEGFPTVVIEALAGNTLCFISDKISKEVNIIPNMVDFFNINDDKKNLCKLILKRLKTKAKVDVIDILSGKGFSIESTSNKISDIYARTKERKV